jgi:aryl-alcohol dehydrogenase-like predicted oxidoreductase
LVLSENTPTGREDGMQTVTLGATRLEVTPLAYGTWQFGAPWGPVDERAAIEAIGHARSLGINFFDTALAYRFGQVTETRTAQC